MAETLRILIVDDQERARKSLRALLSTWCRSAALCEAANGQEAVRMVQEFQPDVVLMDVRMPLMNGPAATRLIKASWPQVKVIALSMYADQKEAAEAAGADAFVGKEEVLDRLLEVLSALMREGG